MQHPTRAQVGREKVQLDLDLLHKINDRFVSVYASELRETCFRVAIIGPPLLAPLDALSKNVLRCGLVVSMQRGVLRSWSVLV